MRPVSLRVPEERLLHTLATYYFLTAEQARRLLYPQQKDSREMQRAFTTLARAGFVQGLSLPATRTGWGTGPNAYTLARAGMNYLATQGVEVTRRFRPSELKDRSAAFLRHHLAVNDVLISLALLTRQYPQVKPQAVLHEETLNRQRVYVTIEQGLDRRTVKRAVIPDAWADLEVTGNAAYQARTAKRGYRTCLAFEIDRGTEYQKDWREKVRSLVAWWLGPYEEAFGSDTVLIAILTVPRENQTLSDAERRRAELLRWTEAELAHLGDEDLADMFLIAAGEPDALTPAELFLEPRWYQPFATAPMPLLPDVT